MWFAERFFNLTNPGTSTQSSQPSPWFARRQANRIATNNGDITVKAIAVSRNASPFSNMIDFASAEFLITVLRYVSETNDGHSNILKGLATLIYKATPEILI